MQTKQLILAAVPTRFGVRTEGQDNANVIIVAQ